MMHFTNRDTYVIAKALDLSIRMLKIRKDPPFGDIQSMEVVMDRFFSSYKTVFAFEANLKKAISRGMTMAEAGNAATIDKWLQDHPDGDAVVTTLNRDEP